MRWLVGFAVLVFPACPLAGQAGLRGRVQADSTRQPIAGASLVISGFSIPVFSNALGRYAILGLTTGHYSLLVRAFGYRPLAVEVEVAAGDTLEADLLLMPDVTVLAPLVTEARPTPFVSGKLEEFERRRARGLGKFFDRKALAAIEPASLERVIRTTAGVRLVYACKRHMAMTMRQGHGGGQDDRMVCLPNIFCPLAVYTCRVAVSTLLGRM